ncbi:MAG: AAA-like domain-containing protein [Pseudomonadota bacterium]
MGQRESSSASETTRSTRPQFFCTTGPLAADRPGYIKRDADTRVASAIEGGTFVNLIGAPMVGKTSLLLRTAQALRDSEEQPAVALIDLAQLAQRESHRDPARWLYAIAFRLSRQLRVSFDLQAWWSDNALLSHRQRMYELFREFVLAFPSRSVILLFDDIDDAEFADATEPLLGAIRMAFDARATDPSMARLRVVFAGGGDAQFNVLQPQEWPYAIATTVHLQNFTLGETLRLAPALGLPRGEAELAMQRVFDWAAGQPALTQFLALGLARNECGGDVVSTVDSLVRTEIAERRTRQPHQVLAKQEAVVLSGEERVRSIKLTTLGMVAKHGRVLLDPDAEAHDTLMRSGLLQMSPDGYLVPASRLIRQYFNAGWANRNQHVRWRGAVVALAVIGLMIAVPFAYQVLLPQPATRVLVDDSAAVSEIFDAHDRLARWPGHQANARRMTLAALDVRAAQSDDPAEIEALALLARERLSADRDADQWLSTFWNARADLHLSRGERALAITALLRAASNEALADRRQIAGLISTDLPRVSDILVTDGPIDQWVYRRQENALVVREGNEISRWPLDEDETLLRRRQTLTLSALTMQPGQFRFDVPQGTRANALSLAVNMNHQRPSDLEMRLRSPAGEEVRIGVEQLSEFGDLQNLPLVDVAAFDDLLAGSVAGEWSIGLVDQRPGATGAVSVRLAPAPQTDENSPLMALNDPLQSNPSDVHISRGAGFAVALPARVGDSVSVWRLASNEVLASYEPTDAITWVGFSAQSRLALFLEAARLIGVRLRDGEPVTFDALSFPLASARLSANGRWLIARSLDDTRQVYLMNLLTESVRRLRLETDIERVIVSDDGALAALLSSERVLQIIDTSSNEILTSYALPVAFQGGYFTRSGRRFVLHGVAGELLVVDTSEDDVARWQPRLTWRSAPDQQRDLSLVGAPGRGFRIHDFDRGRDLSIPFIGLAASDDQLPYLRLRSNLAAITEARAGRITLWRPSLSALPVGSRFVRKAWLNASGEAFAFVDRDERFSVMRMDAGLDELDTLEAEVSLLLHSAPPEIVRFSSDGRLALSIEPSGLYRVRDIESGAFFDFIGKVGGAAIDAAFAPNGDQFLVISPTSFAVFDAISGELLHRELREVSLKAMTAVVGGKGWHLLESDGRVWYQPQIVPGIDSSPIPTDRSLPLAADRILSAESGTMVAAVGHQIWLYPERGDIRHELSIGAEIDEFQFSPSGQALLVRAGQWMYRVAFNRHTATLSHVRLLPPEALAHNGFSIDDAHAMHISLLSGVDEPERVQIRMDYADVAPVAGDIEALRQQWRWLSALRQSDGAPLSSID